MAMGLTRRAGPATDQQRGHDEQELPTFALGAGLGQQVQAEVVEQVDAHADDARTCGSRSATRGRVPASRRTRRRFRAPTGPCRAATGRTRDRGRRGPRRRCSTAEGVASAVTAGVDEHDVALLDSHAGGVELLRGDGVAGLEPVDAASRGMSSSTPWPDDAVLGDLDRAAAGADAGDVCGRRVVVHPPVDEDVGRRCG